MQNTIANKIERSNITQLKNHVNDGVFPHMHDEWTWYVDARNIKKPNEFYQLYSIDFSTNERYKIHGEVAMDWLEVHEVSTHFNEECDGTFYYVGTTMDDSAIAPSYNALQDVVEYACFSPHYKNTAPQEWYGYSEWLAAYVIFKTSPKLKLHQKENWV